MNVKVTMLGSS